MMVHDGMCVEMCELFKYIVLIAKAASKSRDLWFFFVLLLLDLY